MFQRRQEVATSFRKVFKDLIASWNSEDTSDCAWLMYSANYLFRTAGVRWALDPLIIHKRAPEAPAVDLDHVFERLNFVVLTHAHADHLDYDVLGVIQDLPILWVVPDFMLPNVKTHTRLPESRIIVPKPLEPFEINKIRFLPMDGHHYEAALAGGGPSHGVPSMAYLVEFNGKRWFFPGDTRDYCRLFSPSVGPLDGMFAHLWLGRGCALMGEPPLLDEFCQFCVNLNPKQVVLTHLEEFGRDEDDTWELRHVQMVLNRMLRLGLQIPIRAARLGDCVKL